MTSCPYKTMQSSVSCSHIRHCNLQAAATQSPPAAFPYFLPLLAISLLPACNVFLFVSFRLIQTHADSHNAKTSSMLEISSLWILSLAWWFLSSLMQLYTVSADSHKRDSKKYSLTQLYKILSNQRFSQIHMEDPVILRIQSHERSCHILDLVIPSFVFIPPTHQRPKLLYIYSKSD